MTVQVFNFIHEDNSRQTVFAEGMDKYSAVYTGAEQPYYTLTGSQVLHLYDYLKVLEKGGIGRFTHEDAIVLKAMGR